MDNVCKYPISLNWEKDRKTIQERLEAIIMKHKDMQISDDMQLYAFVYDFSVKFVPVSFKDEVESLMRILEFIDSNVQEFSKIYTRRK